MKLEFLSGEVIPGKGLEGHSIPWGEEAWRDGCWQWRLRHWWSCL